MRIILVRNVGTVKRLRISLGTLVAIEATALAAPVSAAGAAVERAFEAITEIDRLMHPSAAGSDLARINSAAVNVPIKVHPSVGELLNFAQRVHALTEGVFDPCTPAQTGRLSDISVSDDETEVVCGAPVALDFGGFAKGYAVDRAVEALMAGGCTSGLVNAGGDMRVFGPQPDPVFVRGPAGELTNIELGDAALAVSDASGQQRPPEHQGYYVRAASPGRASAAPDPSVATSTAAPAAPNPPVAAKTDGSPKNHNAATPPPTPFAAVFANTAMAADALAKCVLLCAPNVAARVLAAFGATRLQFPANDEAAQVVSVAAKAL